MALDFDNVLCACFPDKINIIFFSMMHWDWDDFEGGLTIFIENSYGTSLVSVNKV